MAESDPIRTLRAERESVSKAIEVGEETLARLKKKLSGLDTAISNLEPFYESAEIAPPWLAAPETEIGITDAVRQVYQAVHPGFMSPTSVRDALANRNLLKEYPNEMAVIHQVIRRLQDKEQIEADPSGKTHRWVPRNLLGIRSSRRTYVGEAMKQISNKNAIGGPSPKPGRNSE